MPSDLLGVLVEGNIALDPNIPVIFTANLPYIRANDPAVGDDVYENEPHLALYGGESTGFELYETYFRQMVAVRESLAVPIASFSEIGFDQGELAIRFLAEL